MIRKVVRVSIPEDYNSEEIGTVTPPPPEKTVALNMLKKGNTFEPKGAEPVACELRPRKEERAEDPIDPIGEVGQGN